MRFVHYLTILLFILGCGQSEEAVVKTLDHYAPTIDPSDFVSQITNPYFTMAPGRIWIYEGETEEGTERIEVTVLQETKKILGVTTLVVQDQVFLNDELIEDTLDWYAQDREGNVWYFGEKTEELEDGKITSSKGSWEAGINGAQPGIVMKSNPQVRDSYRQEYYAGEAEDMAEVLAHGETVTVALGTYKDCLKTRDWTPLTPGADEYKWYCPEVGGFALEIGIESGERVELVEWIDS